MPIDLAPAGVATPYPKHGPRLLPWLFIWSLFAGLGAGLAIFLWPANLPAEGFDFWFCVAMAPSLAYLLVLSLARLAFDSHWLRADGANHIRQEWIARKQAEAQRSLQVLGSGHCLPCDGQTLASVVASGRLLLRAQTARKGPGMIVHNRFDEEHEAHMPATESSANEGAREVNGRKVSTVMLKIGEALAPLTPSLTALSQYGPGSHRPFGCSPAMRWRASGCCRFGRHWRSPGCPISNARLLPAPTAS